MLLCGRLIVSDFFPFKNTYYIDGILSQTF